MEHLDPIERWTIYQDHFFKLNLAEYLVRVWRFIRDFRISFIFLQRVHSFVLVLCDHVMRKASTVRQSLLGCYPLHASCYCYLYTRPDDFFETGVGIVIFYPKISPQYIFCGVFLGKKCHEISKIRWGVNPCLDKTQNIHQIWWYGYYQKGSIWQHYELHQYNSINVQCSHIDFFNLRNTM